MDSKTLTLLLEAAGYELGHAHLSGVPTGQPDTVLVVVQEKDQAPPCSGVIDHIESEEPDKFVGTVITSIERLMGRYNVQHGPNGQVLWIFLNIPTSCPEVKEASNDAALLSAINSRGSRAIN